MNFKNIIIFLFCTLSFSKAQLDSANNDGEFSIIRIKDGVKIIYNSDNSNFHFDILCENFRQIEASNMMFMADNVLLQITPVPLEFILGSNVDNLSDSLKLLYHFAFEVRNIRSNLSGDFKIYDEFIKQQGHLMYYWHFDMPKQKETEGMETVIGQHFATTMALGRILMLSGIEIERNEPGEVKTKLIESLQTLIVSIDKLDPEKIREQLSKEEELD